MPARLWCEDRCFVAVRIYFASQVNAGLAISLSPAGWHVAEHAVLAHAGSSESVASSSWWWFLFDSHREPFVPIAAGQMVCFGLARGCTRSGPSLVGQEQGPIARVLPRARVGLDTGQSFQRNLYFETSDSLQFEFVLRSGGMLLEGLVRESRRAFRAGCGGDWKDGMGGLGGEPAKVQVRTSFVPEALGFAFAGQPRRLSGIARLRLHGTDECVRPYTSIVSLGGAGFLPARGLLLA